MWSKKKTDDEEWNEMNAEVARLTQEKNWDEALSLAEEVLRYTKKCYGKKDPKTIIALNNLGIVNLMNRDFEKAEAYLLLALQLTEKVSGKYSREALNINTNLARLHSERARVIREINETEGMDITLETKG